MPLFREEPATLGFSAEAREPLLALRRDLHQHPELAFAEVRTAATLERALARLAPVAKCTTPQFFGRLASRLSALISDPRRLRSLRM